MPDLSIDDLQHLMWHGWPGLEHQMLGEWVLRAGGGYTSRANSALAAGDPGIPNPIEEVECWYATRGLPARLQVSADNPATILYASLGWKTHHAYHYRTRPT